MAAVDFFTSFTYKWGQDGSVYNWDDTQYKQGWATIGAVPPSVEQFNRVHQLADEKSNWLFAQLKTAADANGVTLSATDFEGLLKILDGYSSDLPRIRTFAQATALTENIGPIIVIGMDGIWEWVQTAHFTGYRHPYCGMWMDGWTPTPLPFQIPATGGTWRESDEKERRVIARYRESGLVVPSANWIKGQNMISDLGGGNWKAPDLQDMFKRMTGTDVDTANARVLGSHQMDALQNITGSISQWKVDHAIFEIADGVFAPGPVASSGDVPGVTGGNPPAMFKSFSFDASRVVRTAAETRSLSSATSPFIHV